MQQREPETRHWNLPLVAMAALGLACGPGTDPTSETDTDPPTSSATYDYYDTDYCADGTGGCCFDDECGYEDPECVEDLDCIGSGAICTDLGTCIVPDALPECESAASPIVLELPMDPVHPLVSLAFVEADGDPGSELVVGHFGRAELYLDTVPMPVELPWVDPDAVLDTVSGDFDGDGDLDLAMSTGQSGLLMMTNDGSGSYTAALDPAVMLPTSSLEVLEWNGDGVPDLAGLDPDGQVQLLLGDGAGGFQPFVLVPQLGEVRSMAAGRFDGDALDDLVVFDDADATPVYLGNAEGDLDGDSTLFGEVHRERRLLAGALGGGANDEILSLPELGALDSSSLLELWSDAGGEPQLSTITGPIGRAAMGDLDGDGADDLVMTQLSSILYVRGGSSGENATLSCLASYYSFGPNTLDAIAVGDLDGNGRADVAYASAGAVTILLTE